MNPELEEAYAEMGEVNENRYKPIINETYGTYLRKTRQKFCQFDFIGDNYAGELKSRNLSINDHINTMIGYNKVVAGHKKLEVNKNKMNYKVYFWFAFKEGLYSWELNKENYEANGGDSKKFMGGTTNRGYSNIKEHYNIQVKNLVKISDIPVYINPLVEANTKKRTHKSSIPEGVCFLNLLKG